MPDDIIKIRIIGSDSDGGDVRLSDFIEQLNAVRDALRETGRSLYGRDIPDVDFRVVDLKHSSPSAVYLKPISQRPYRAKAARIGPYLVSGLSAIKNKRKPPAHADVATLESYRDITKPMQRHVQRLEIEAPGRKAVAIDSSFGETVNEAIGPDLFAAGSISGLLERINLHNVQKFDIYPLVGPRRVRCSFSEKLLEEVRSGLRRHVTVYGSVRYKSWDKYPYAVDARQIDVHEEDDSLPSIFDLHGIAPDATGELSSEDFVRMLRETDW